jgi:23S rRNA pseudouridine1911/1915/1917 synthase
MTNNYIEEKIVPPQVQGKRVDAVLAHLFPQFSRSLLTQWLKRGAVKVNQQVLKPKEKVYGGELIQLVVEPQVVTETIPQDIPLDIVFEDDHLFIINKPAGLIVHPGAGNPEKTLVNAILHYLPLANQLPRAGIIHRLDKNTTGLLIAAKTLTCYTLLTRMMQDREINRSYLALVYGHLVSGKTIGTAFGRHPRNRLKMTVTTQGREAVTEYSIRKKYQYFTLLDVKLHTGRTHQIRVHMEYIHHSIVGDTLYGGRTRLPPKCADDLKIYLQNFKRQALHAYRLNFLHPITQEQLTFQADLPEDFQHLLNLLDENFENLCA